MTEKPGKWMFPWLKVKLTVYHTEVNPEYEGRGFAKLLLEKLVSYAREKQSEDCTALSICSCTI
jgi:predicted GNAT family acetyltransferase